MKILTQRRNALAVFLLFATVTTTAVGQETSEMRCRGGGFWIETVGSRIDSSGETMLTLSLQFNYTAQWIPREPVSETHEIPAHWVLGRSSCAWLANDNGGPYGSAKPGVIRFETPANAQLKQKLHGSEVDKSPTAAESYPDARSIPEYLKDPNHYWTFHIARLVCEPTNCEAPGSHVLHLVANAHGYYKQPINLGGVARPAEDFKARKPNRPIDVSGLSTREATGAPNSTVASESVDAASTQAAARTSDATSAQAAVQTALSDRQNAQTVHEQVAKNREAENQKSPLNATGTILGAVAGSQVGTTIGPAVKAQARVRMPDGTTSKSTLSKCEAAKVARARNSPAAPGLEAQCAAQLALEASSVASSGQAVASESRGARKADLQRKVADENQRLKEISAESNETQDRSGFSKFADWLLGSDPGRESGVATAVEKQGPGGAARRVAPAFQPENTIAVRVRYRKEYGYKADTSALGPVGAASCAVFSISAAVSDGSARQRNPISISSSSRMVDGGDYYVCNYIASGIPLDQAIAVNVAVVGPDLSAAWEGGDATEPPAGQQRTILDATRTAMLNASQPRARLSYEMVYGPATTR